jgi:hypothetical protein
MGEEEKMESIIMSEKMIIDLEEDAAAKHKPLVLKRPRETLYKHLAIWAALTAYCIALFILGKGKVGSIFLR